MNFLSLLLGLVILVAILYQTVFTPVVGKKTSGPIKTPTSRAFQALQDAEKLKQTMNNQNQNMSYEDSIKNH